MGFCLFNHIAVAARHALEEGGLERVAIVDFDAHHGNGTQEAFYEDGRVAFLSLHLFPFYPGSGSAAERGSGAGAGRIRNLPLDAATPPARYHEALREGLDEICAFRPHLFLVSAGFDGYRDDPLAGLNLLPPDFEAIGEAIGAAARTVAEGRVVSLYEGGYVLRLLPELVLAYLDGLERGAA
jgi:acetoin utilization deacetylase AcuC-like enzyme